jgi:hypothetical protein
MINIQRILESDSYESMISKINQNLEQLAVLNGGPIGKRGYMGLPGLPGLQGRRGYTGDDGLDGTTFYLVNSNPNDPTMEDPTSLPLEADLETLVGDGTYNEGDCFMSSEVIGSPAETIEIFYKIVKIGDDYKYAKFSLKVAAIDEDNSFKNWQDVINGTAQSFVINKTTSIENAESYDDNISSAGDTRNRFRLNFFLSSINDSETGITEPLESIGGLPSDPASSVFKPILFWQKRHFKLGIDQILPYEQVDSDISDADFIALTSAEQGNYYISASPENQFPNIWGMAFTGDEINLISPAVTNTISEFSYLKKTSPVLYLQSLYNDAIDNIDADSNYSNFGVFVKRIKSTALGSSSYKSILIFASDSNNDNEIYFKQKNIWSEGNFVSEINANNISNANRYYSTFVLRDYSKFGSYGYVSNFFGISDYGNTLYSGLADTTQRTFTKRTGFQFVTKQYPGQGLYDEIRLYKTSSTTGNAPTTKLICNIDRYGYFKYSYNEINAGIDLTEKDDSFFTIDSQDMWRFTGAFKVKTKSHTVVNPYIAETGNDMFVIHNSTYNTSWNISAHLYPRNNQSGTGYFINRKFYGNSTWDRVFSIEQFMATTGAYTNINSYGTITLKAISDYTQGSNYSGKHTGDIHFVQNSTNYPAADVSRYVAGIKKYPDGPANNILGSYFYVVKGASDAGVIPQPYNKNVVLYIGGEETSGSGYSYGKIQIKDNTQSADYIFTCNSQGVGSWTIGSLLKNLDTNPAVAPSLDAFGELATPSVETYSAFGAGSPANYQTYSNYIVSGLGFNNDLGSDRRECSYAAGKVWINNKIYTTEELLVYPTNTNVYAYIEIPADIHTVIDTVMYTDVIDYAETDRLYLAETEYLDNFVFSYIEGDIWGPEFTITGSLINTVDSLTPISLTYTPGGAAGTYYIQLDRTDLTNTGVDVNSTGFTTDTHYSLYQVVVSGPGLITSIIETWDTESNGCVSWDITDRYRLKLYGDCLDFESTDGVGLYRAMPLPGITHIFIDNSTWYAGPSEFYIFIFPGYKPGEIVGGQQEDYELAIQYVGQTVNIVGNIIDPKGWQYYNNQKTSYTNFIYTNIDNSGFSFTMGDITTSSISFKCRKLSTGEIRWYPVSWSPALELG